MNNLNNLYNFKNPIRHFFNLDNINFDMANEVNIKDLVWTEPVKCKIFKTQDTTRLIKFPNILNFYKAIEKFKALDDFYKIKELSNRKRVSPDLTTGEFSVMSYDESIQKDLYNLTKYDKLLILDIKSFYGRIYTHDFEYENVKDQDAHFERRVTSLNSGKTNGILLGSYLSLYLAEKFLIRIERQLENDLKNKKILCEFEYFSDDFYFFCNNKDISQIKNIFSNVLELYELELNNDKSFMLDFEEYSKMNNLDKQWKKIINHANLKDEEYKNKANKDEPKYPTFLTQLVYRLSMIGELKYKRIFVNNFFKTSFFQSFNEKEYVLSKSDFNYLCYLYKLMPETMLYSLEKMEKMKGFNKVEFKDFIKVRFASALDTEKHEEQLYIYYAITTCQQQDILTSFKEQVLNSKNQVLISYFILDEIILKEDYENFVSESKENEWLQNYHYVLMCDSTNLELLIPKMAKKNKNKASYLEFYKKNIEEKIPLVRPIGKFSESIKSYIESKINSYKLVENIERGRENG